MEEGYEGFGSGLAARSALWQATFGDRYSGTVQRSETIYRTTCDATGMEMTLREGRLGCSVFTVVATVSIDVNLTFAVFVPDAKAAA